MRRGLAGIAVAAAVAATGSVVHATEPACARVDDIRVMVVPATASSVTTSVAAEHGFFRKHCLNPTLVPVDVGPAGFAHTLIGNVHVGDASLGDLLRARNKDLKLKAIAGESSAIPYALVVGKRLAAAGTAGYAEAMKALVGGKIGLARLAADPQHFAESLLREAGGAAGSYVPVRSLPEQLAALDSGAVDAVLMNDLGPDVAVAGGHGRIVADLRRPGTGPSELQQLVGTFQIKVASEAFLRDYPDVARRYVAAHAEAAAWIREAANAGEVVKQVRARLMANGSPAMDDRAVTDYARRYVDSRATAISRRGVAAWYAFERGRGEVKSRITVDQVVWSEAPLTE